MPTPPAQLAIDPTSQTLRCSGNWTLNGIITLAREHPTLSRLSGKTVTLNADHITLDSAGAWLLYEWIHRLEKQGKTITLNGFTTAQQTLLELIKAEFKSANQPLKTPVRLSLLERTGKRTLMRLAESVQLLAFIGELLMRCLNCIRRPSQFQWRSFLNVIDSTGYRALPIVGMLSLSIGIVLTYQMGEQLKIYGANVYIVSMIGLGVLQEFGPLITAIIVAGRTSSAFTAEIGAMKINEEIDALRTMGIAPVAHLAIPKITGLLIALPLLVLWADIFGVIGGMIISKQILNISYYNFLLRFPMVVELNTLLKGLLKAPFFALIISGTGCFQGFQVSYNTESVGKHTTKSVVQAIFWIIIVDSLFSIILPWQTIE